jgi:hypothetical protein
LNLALKALSLAAATCTTPVVQYICADPPDTTIGP